MADSQRDPWNSTLIKNVEVTIGFLTQTVFISVNFFLASYKQEMRVFFAEKSQMKINRAENFRMGDIEINAWSSLFDNLKINLILQDYLESVWKTIKFKLIFNHLRNCSSQSEKSGQPMREQKHSHWRKQLTDIQGERKRVD